MTQSPCGIAFEKLNRMRIENGWSFDISRMTFEQIDGEREFLKKEISELRNLYSLNQDSAGQEKTTVVKQKNGTVF